MLSKKDSYGNKDSFKYFIGYISNGHGIITLYKRLPQINAFITYFKDSKYMNLLVYDKELLKNTMKYGIKLKIYLKRKLIVNKCIMINNKN